MTLIKIIFFLKFLVIACGFFFVYGMEVEARYNKDIREFEYSLQDDLESGRDFILFGEYKIYKSAEKPKNRYYKKLEGVKK